MISVSLKLASLDSERQARMLTFWSWFACQTLLCYFPKFLPGAFPKTQEPEHLLLPSIPSPACTPSAIVLGCSFYCTRKCNRVLCMQPCMCTCGAQFNAKNHNLSRPMGCLTGSLTLNQRPEAILFSAREHSQRLRSRLHIPYELGPLY